MENNHPADYPNCYMFQSEPHMYGRPSGKSEISDINKLGLPSKLKFEDLFNDEERHSLNLIVPPEVTSFIKSEVADQIEAISEAFNDDHDHFDDISKKYVMNQWSDISFKLDEDGLCKLKIKSESKVNAKSKNKRKPTKKTKTKKFRGKLSPKISPKNCGLNFKCNFLQDPLSKLCVNNNEGYDILTVVGNKTREIKMEKKDCEQHRPHQYSCKYQDCFYSFANLKDLQKHYLEEHRGAVFACTTCSFMTINQHALRQHQFCHHQSNNQLSRRNSATYEKKLDVQSTYPQPSVSTYPQLSVLKNKFTFSVKFESHKGSKRPAIKEMFSLRQFPNGGKAEVQLVSLVPTKSPSMSTLPSNIKLESRNIPETNGRIFSPHPSTATPNVQTGTLPRLREKLLLQPDNFSPIGEVVKVGTLSHIEQVVKVDSLPPMQEKLVMDLESSSDVATEVDMYNNQISPSLENYPKFYERRRRNECKKGFSTLKEIVPELYKIPRASRLTILKKANEYIHLLQKGHAQLRKEIMLEVQRNEKLKMLMNQMNK